MYCGKTCWLPSVRPFALRVESALHCPRSLCARNVRVMPADDTTLFHGPASCAERLFADSHTGTLSNPFSTATIDKNDCSAPFLRRYFFHAPF